MGTSYKLPNLTDGAKYYVKVTSYRLVGTGKEYGTTEAASAIYTLKRAGTPSVKKYAWGKVVENYQGDKRKNLLL